MSTWFRGALSMLDIKPMAGALGAEIHGLDLSRELDEEDFLRIRKSLNEYQLIFFRDQDISPAKMTALADAIAENPPVRHPVIRTHPETGKKAIFVNSLFTTHIEGLRPAESDDALLSFLFRHVTTDEFTCRFHWQPNSLAIWDNRCTQHRPVNDYFPAHRRMERTTIDGDKPY